MKINNNVKKEISEIAKKLPEVKEAYLSYRVFDGATILKGLAKIVDPKKFLEDNKYEEVVFKPSGKIESDHNYKVRSVARRPINHKKRMLSMLKSGQGMESVKKYVDKYINKEK